MGAFFVQLDQNNFLEKHKKCEYPQGLDKKTSIKKQGPLRKYFFLSMNIA